MRLAQGKSIFYLDKTWVNEGHTVQKVWTDTSIHNRRQAFNERFTNGLQNPAGRGRRLIFLYIGSCDGFVKDDLLLFEGKKTTDYHDEMNAIVLEEWLSRILNYSPDNAVIVTDNASYADDDRF
ncbi:spondin [Holotrichia oblita]|uniref:Spondin n=1 Tax=Holotrichia oblita TaxID=644536 RepID=A0ACB9SZZ8_HOLOL|nr:spondin [Holotrichia oblita]